MAYYLPHLQIRSRSIVEYTANIERDNFKFRTENQIENQKKFIEKSKDEGFTYSGLLRPGTKKRLTKSVENLATWALRNPRKEFYWEKKNKTVKYRLTFITLTIHSPNEIILADQATKQCLEPMLLFLKRKYGMSLYLWKAELQRRGHVHYHIVSDCFIPVYDLRNKWNELISPHGWLNDYEKKYGHKNVNSTDVHRVEKLDIAGYLKKEIVKCYQNDTSIKGKVWDCSISLKSKGYPTIIDFNGEMLCRLDNGINERKVKKTVTPHCNFYQISKKTNISSFMSEIELHELDVFLEELKNYERKKPEIKQEIIPPKKITDSQLQLFQYN